ncbi:putative amine oxidase [Diaporthe ampelina]|uniref:monoamine oxidase n=1 Tax=Diaporthe ampelina TaxID=1214573 RepID=A0A0G2FTU0_9PEZI|nr:putative amine oxidase [Diaporthe ampelina]
MIRPGHRQLQAQGTAPEQDLGNPGNVVIHRDLVVVGGGATGVYSAWRAIEGGNLSVSVIEASDRLGGHVNTFYDPATNRPVDYGVQAYINNEQTQEFFARFDIALNASTTSPFKTYVADFAAGVVIPNATYPDPTTLIEPLINYLTVMSTNFPFLSEGAFDLPDPVPEDLLMPFGQFVTKYNISDVVSVIFTFAHTVGNLLEAPTLYVVQNFGAPHILGLASGYMYAPAGNQAVYDAAAEWLSDRVVYNTKVASTTRNQDGTTNVKLSNGAEIVAKKVLVTIPPTLDNLSGFDLDDEETYLFEQWSHVPYFVGVTTQTGLPDLTNFINVDTSSVGNLPSTPYVWRLETVGVSGYQTVKIIGEADSAKAQGLVYDTVTKLDKSLATLSLGGSTGPADDIFAAWEEHALLGLNVPTESVQECMGF